MDLTEILDSHTQPQTARLRDVNDLLVMGDTTILTFPSHPAKEGLGEFGTSETDLKGVKVHSSIGVRPDTTWMTGLLDQQVLIEDQQTDEKYDTNGRADPFHLVREQAKWLRGDRHARDALPDSVRPIFVHDRGGRLFVLSSPDD